MFRSCLSKMGRHRERLWLFACLTVAAALFAQAVDYPLMNTWDDGVYVLDRPEVIDWWSASWSQRILTPDIGYPLPLPTFIYAHAHQWFGEYAVQVLRTLCIAVHLANALLIFRLVARWFGRRLGAVVASLWVVHPIVVESVTWATNLKTVLAAFFLLGAMNLWEGVREKADRSKTLRTYGAILVCFIAAAGCRPDAAIMPAVLATQCLLCERPAKSLRAHAVFLVPLTALAAGYLVFSDTGHGEIVERSVFFDEGLEATLARIFHALEIGTRNLIWPVDLHPAYFQHWREGILEALPGMAIATALVAIIVALLAAGRRRIAFAPLLAMVLYAPFSNVVFLPRFTADTYLYLVSFAALTTVLVILRLLIKVRAPGWLENSRMRAAGAVILVTLFAAYATLTWGQVQRWEDPIALWAPVIEEQPNVPRPYRHIGWEYARRGDFEEARSVLESGYDAFRASRDIPALFPEVLAKAGEPRRSAQISVEAIRHNRDVEALHYRVYLETLAAENLPLPDDRRVIEATDEAVEEYLERDEWLGEDASVSLALASYFLEQGRSKWAASFVQAALERAGESCAPWKLAERLSSQRRDALQLPPRPSHCASP
ncbi:MAG: hypothetical protein ACOCV2_00015 [Persicimonas sp.]